ncbi:hypothetical protein [Haloferula sargassicola]|uniref:Uncharacterized protein n=1 Tax=Haloferula sargassicola TaxID=490096 RepID=A0ABP9UQ39_9BACT
MKKPIAIVVALMILTMIIGFERIGRVLQFVISDGRTERVRRSGVSAEEEIRDSRATDSATFREADRSFSTDHSQTSELPDSMKEQVTRGSNHSRSNHIGIDVTGRLSPFHYIRSSEITGTTEITSAEIQLLQQAVRILGDGLEPSALILDADALTTSDIPFSLVVREEFDLTDQAKQIYERLQAEGWVSPNTGEAEKVDQVGAAER